MILDDLDAFETRAELADVLKTLFDKVSPHEELVARADRAASGEFDRPLWDRLNQEVGVITLTVPEELGGSGATVAETAVVLELIGRRAAGIPFLGAFLTTEALVRSGASAALDRWLEPLMSGATIGAVAWGGSLTAARSNSGWAIGGEVTPVIDGYHADLLVVPASAADGERWFAVDLTGRCNRRRVETLDLTRDVTALDLFDAPAVPLTEPGDGALGRVLHDLATLALAVEQLGVAEQAVADAVEYAKLREQFGRTIGSFQALKHLLADMATETDLARSLVEHALWVAAERPADLSEAAAMAILGASRAAVFSSAENVQVHGGIGFTWEHPAHLYFRKARSNEVILSSRAEYADRILTARGATP